MNFKDIINKYHIKDTRNIEKLLPKRQVLDVTITSPPYWNLKNYGFTKQIGFGQSYEQYLTDIANIFKIIYERTKNTGSLWIVADTFKQNGELRLLPFDIAKNLKNTGWILQDIIIWNKDKTLPWSHQGKLRNIFEYIVFFSKSKEFKYNVSRVRDVSDLKNYWVQYPERYSPKGKAPSRSWKFSIPLQGCWGGENNFIRHACPLPTALIDRILLLSSDKKDVILDPFAGSGSVLATAHSMGRKFIGIDKNREYKKMFLKNVLPTINKQYKSNDKNTNQYEKVKDNFCKTIKALRNLKYPRELVQIYNKRYKCKLKNCCGILALPNKSNKKPCFMFIFRNKDKIPLNFLKRIKALSAKSPLSGYGINPSFTVISQIRLTTEKISKKGLELSQKIHIYRNGCFYKCDKCLSSEDLQAQLTNGAFSKYKNDRYPPIFSNLNISIDPKQPELVLENKKCQK